MKKKILIPVMGLALLGFVGCTDVSQPYPSNSSSQPMGAVSETATCKLTNVAAGKTLYDGSCRITQEETKYNTVYTVKMGSGESFMFAGQKGSTAWMHGAESTHFTDLPTGGIFKWSDFALVVAE